MLGYTLENIRVGFDKRSHNNKDIKKHTKLPHLPSCTCGRQSLRPQCCPPMPCHCHQMCFPSLGPVLLQLCAGSSLNHHHHHSHPWLIFMPPSGPSARACSAAAFPLELGPGAVWGVPAGSGGTAKNSLSAIPRCQSAGRS